MGFSDKLLFFFSSLGAFNGLVLSIYFFFFAPKKQLSNFLLGGLLLVLSIRIGKSVVMLNHDAELFPHHIDEGQLYDFSAPVAAVAVHPASPNVWGLKNLTKEKWFISTSEGKVKDVLPEQSVTLAVGTKIQFGKTEGEIRL